MVPKSRKAAAEESREKLLNVGLEMLAEYLRSPVENIRSTEVARRAGLTPGAFYHHWPSQDDYREDLRAMVAGQAEVEASLTRLGEVFGGGDEGNSPLDAFRAGCRNELVTQAADPSWHVQLAMLASPHAEDLRQSALQYERWIAACVDFYAQLFVLIGIELKPGLTMDWLARTVTALSEGYAMQLRSGLQRTASDEGLGAGWEPYATSVAAVLASAGQRTDHRPIAPGSPQDQLRQMLAP